LRVAPNTVLNVCEPAPNSGMFVLPSAIAPAPRCRATTALSASGTKSRKMGEPNVVRIPRVRNESLCATGNPCNGPSASPNACARSARRAAPSARSASSVTIAFTCAFMRSIRSRWAVMTSTAPSSPARIRRVSSVAERKHISSRMVQTRTLRT
jgi:hypothetical protein